MQRKVITVVTIGVERNCPGLYKVIAVDSTGSLLTSAIAVESGGTMTGTSSVEVVAVGVLVVIGGESG